MTDADSTVIEASLDDVLDEMMIRDAVDDHLDFRAVRLSMSTLDRDAQRGRISRYTSRFMITRLLFLVEGHRVDRLTFGVLAFRGGCPCFSIGRQNDGDDSRRFSILLEGEARSRLVDSC